MTNTTTKAATLEQIRSILAQLPPAERADIVATLTADMGDMAYEVADHDERTLNLALEVEEKASRLSGRIARFAEGSGCPRASR